MSRTFDLSDDPNNPIPLLLLGEDFDTSAPIEIQYSEERENPELVETHASEGSGTTRTFYVAWERRFEFVENLLGFAKVISTTGVGNGGPGEDSRDPTGWNGKRVHRVNPLGWAMGKGSDDSDKWVFAVRATVMPDGRRFNEIIDAGDGSDTFIYRPGATYAKCLVQFAAVDFTFLPDTEVLGTGSPGSGIVSGGLEWKRNTRIVQKPASQFFNYPTQALQMVDNPAVGQKKPFPQSPAVLDNVADLWIQVLDLPYDPIGPVYQVFGKGNRFPFLETSDFPAGHPAESLHFVAADIVRKPDRCSRRYWDASFGFKKVFNRDYFDPDPTSAKAKYGELVGVNYVRDIYESNVGGVVTKKLRLFRVSQDGTGNLNSDNPLVPLDDLRKMFWIP